MKDTEVPVVTGRQKSNEGTDWKRRPRYWNRRSILHPPKGSLRLRPWVNAGRSQAVEWFRSRDGRKRWPLPKSGGRRSGRRLSPPVTDPRPRRLASNGEDGTGDGIVKPEGS